MRPVALLLVALLLPAAGCLGWAAQQEDIAPAAHAPQADPAGGHDETVGAPDEPAATASPSATSAIAATGPVPSLTTGGLLGQAMPVIGVGEVVTFSGACEGACPASSFTLARLPDEGRDRVLLEVRVHWDGTVTRGFELRLDGPDGATHVSARGFDSARVLLVAPLAGDYVLHVAGNGRLDGTVTARQLGVARSDDGNLLPNLVTLVPTRVATGLCDPWETVEQGARRCLRLANAIGNVGDGPLEVALALDQGALTPVGQGSFVQRIHQATGAPREVPVGAAHFHGTHAHFHYDGLARFSLYAVDGSTGLRQALVSEHKKAGFCLLDSGQMSGADVDVEPSNDRRAEQACLIPSGQSGWSMGVSRGYYDLYGSGLTDQYVEITGVDDGLYELVSECDWAGTLHELDETDNAASVLLRIRGSDVDVLEERGFHHLPKR